MKIYILMSEVYMCKNNEKTIIAVQYIAILATDFILGIFDKIMGF